MDQGEPSNPNGSVGVDGRSVVVDDLIPRWLFFVRGPIARIAVAILVPLGLGLAMVAASEPSDLRFGPLLALGAIIVAATTSWRATIVAGALIELGYWWWGVPPEASFRLHNGGDIAAVVAMAALNAGLIVLTRRIAVTVDQVRHLDVQRRNDLAHATLLRDQAQRLADQLAEILRTGGQLAGCTTPQEVAEALLECATLPAPPTTASVAVVEGDHLRVLASHGSSPEAIRMLERADLTTSTWLGDVLAGKPVLVPDREAFATEHPTARALQLYPAGSWVVLPFRTEGSVGMLSLHYLTPQPLQDFELYFSLLAELLSTSLARSSSEAARRRELRELERSFAERDRIARTLSTSLIPTVLPDLPGFRTDHWLEPASADQVAGDFYDLFTVGHGDWIAVLGDVSGKGAEAAAVTSLARYAARTSALSRPDPLSVVDLVDRALTADSSDLYCTMVVVRWCSDQEELQVALAGHHPARLITDDGVQRVGAFGSAAGLDMGSFRLDTAAFHHGDVLLLFSDGLIERDPAFGEDELDELLASAPRDPGELVRHLQRHVERLAVVHPDDIAVLALQRTPE